VRIAITGLGVVSPAGVGARRFGSALRRGRSLVRRVEVAGGCARGEIGAPVSGFDALDFLERRTARRLDRSAHLFVAASRLAVEDARLECRVDPERVGVYEGTSLGGLDSALRERRRPTPSVLTRAMTGTGASMVSILERFHGPVFTFSNGSGASACSLKGAVDQLRLGEVDCALAGGAEAPLSAPVLAAFRRAGLLSSRVEEPEGACRPFDATRDGIVLGEGAAVFVLERWDDAVGRGATILGEIVAIALTSDAASLVAPGPETGQPSRAIREVLARAGVTADDVDYVSAHGTGTRLNDSAETKALKQGLGPRAKSVPVSSSKSMFGHALGASTALELAKTIVAMRDGFVPPTVNLHEADPECDLDYVPGESRPAEVVTALVNNSSFGGKNASLLVRRGPPSSPSGVHATGKAT